MEKILVRQMLEQKLSEVVRNHDSIETESRRPGDTDFEDEAVGLETEEVLNRRDAMVIEEIKAIRAAIGRLESGTYGVCTECGGAIGAARLAAVPEAALCVRCESRHEGERPAPS